MAEVTKYGVCYDIENSPYEYAWNGILYKFSSEPHRQKFIKELWKRIDWLDDSLSRRFRIQVYCEELAVIQLYIQVETRGFCIVYDGNKVIKCPEQLVFHGHLYSAESYAMPSQHIMRPSQGSQEIPDMLG